MDMTATEAIRQGIYGGYLADRARELEAEFREIVTPGGFVDAVALAQWAGRASVTLGLIADEFGDLPGPALGDPDDAEAQRIAEVFADANAEYDRIENEDRDGVQ